jgi:hypothetical protein
MKKSKEKNSVGKYGLQNLSIPLNMILNVKKLTHFFYPSVCAIFHRLPHRMRHGNNSVYSLAIKKGTLKRSQSREISHKPSGITIIHEWKGYP